MFARTWSERMRTSGAPPEVIAEAISTSLLDLFTYVDTISGGLSAAYLEERERWSRSLEATRMDLARAILDGSVIDEAGTERRLNHRLDGPNTRSWSGATPSTRAGCARRCRPSPSR